MLNCSFFKQNTPGKRINRWHYIIPTGTTLLPKPVDVIQDHGSIIFLLGGSRKDY
jgi:hypothetical protein